VESLDVKYTVSGGCDQELDPDLVKPHQDLAPRGRSRRAALLQLPTISDADENRHSNRRRSLSRSLSRARKPRTKKKRTPTKLLKSPRPFGHRLNAMVQAAVSPRKDSHQLQSPSPRGTSTRKQNRNGRFSPSVPQEVVIGGDDSPESRLSMGTFLSPFGSADDMVPAQIRTHTNFASMDCDDSDDEHQRRSSPTYARLMEARHMAAGRYSVETKHSTDPSALERLAIATSAAKPPPAAKRGDDDDDDDETMASCEPQASQPNQKSTTRVHLTLREVWDDSYKKASKFIGDVVSGGDRTAAKEKEKKAPEPEKEDESMADNHSNNNHEDDRLNQFRTLLNEVLLNSDGMMEEAMVVVAEEMSDYTEDEVSGYLTQLSAQNKIMQTDGWIYNI